MDEKNNFQSQTTGIRVPQRQNTQITDAQKQAAVNYRREKIEQIYSGKTNYSTPQTTPLDQAKLQAQPTAPTVPIKQINQPQTLQPTGVGGAQKVISPINQKPAIAPNNATSNGVAPKNGVVDFKPRTNQQRAQIHEQSNQSQDQWRRYHAAWQNYYQKYYESYYNAALVHHKKTVANIQPEVVENLTEEQKKERALAQLRKNIAQKARERTQKIRKSRHFVPIFSVMVVVLLFVFLQYNRLIFATVEAYVSPGNATAEETIQTPNSTVAVGSQPKLIIPKINVDVPVVYGVGNDAASQLKAMENGVAHFAIPGANSVPGQVGNTVLSGHSSNDLFDGGDYKFIFAQLDKLEAGDVFYANYEGVRYSYVVRRKEVVLPTEVNKIVLNTDKPWMTLITCTPLGTAEKRLLVFAEQVSPNPASAKPAETSVETSSSNAELPRNSKTFFERLFSWDWN